MSDPEDVSLLIEPNSWDRASGPIHRWFGLSYAGYLVIPRIVLTSLPVETQARLVALLEEIGETVDYDPPPGGFAVFARDERGRFETSDLGEYRHRELFQITTRELPPTTYSQVAEAFERLEAEPIAPPELPPIDLRDAYRAAKRIEEEIEAATPRPLWSRIRSKLRGGRES